MNHFMLRDKGDEASPSNASARYGVYAIEILINHLLKLGVRCRGLKQWFSEVETYSPVSRSRMSAAQCPFRTGVSGD
jgi:hypothetical protein